MRHIWPRGERDYLEVGGSVETTVLAGFLLLELGMGWGATGLG